ncbi:hypothetical protein C8Q70DRAFT_954612 [Cubamyces menziesii]|nr:hypothetical protein C8Q70DRAFT_954612 [Cubamyces menziesii]
MRPKANMSLDYSNSRCDHRLYRQGKHPKPGLSPRTVTVLANCKTKNMTNPNMNSPQVRPTRQPSRRPILKRRRRRARVSKAPQAAQDYIVEPSPKPSHGTKERNITLHERKTRKDRRAKRGPPARTCTAIISGAHSRPDRPLRFSVIFTSVRTRRAPGAGELARSAMGEQTLTPPLRVPVLAIIHICHPPAADAGWAVPSRKACQEGKCVGRWRAGMGNVTPSPFCACAIAALNFGLWCFDDDEVEGGKVLLF